MATVTGLTADRMIEIEAASVVDGDVVDGELILTKHDGSTINAGSVAGPPGPMGPLGSDLDVLVQAAILDIGIPGQIRAGRQLAVSDFTDIGLAAPTGLWNFTGDFNDSSGNSHALTAKGSAAYARGIEGVDNTAVQFNGSNAFYIVDSGVDDPFRFKVGSFGAWVRTAKQGTLQSIITKRGPAPQLGYWLRISTANVADFGFTANGTTIIELFGLSKICDDRWHFIVGTYDGILMSLYVDGILEASALHSASGSELIFGSNQPFNIGAYDADASTAPAEPLFGRIDEAFVTSEAISLEKVFNLYCARIAHTLGTIPSGASLNVYPGAKGASLVSGDFPAAPLRLYNFSAGSIANEGSNPSAGLTVFGTPDKVAGVDGTKDNAYYLSGTPRFTATDAGLPSGAATCSYGCWFKCANGTGTMYILTWGTTNGTNDARIYLAAGLLNFGTGSGTPVAGPFVSDGQWHFVVVVQDNTAADGVKRKFYLDGRLIASSTALGSIVLGGAGKFVIGSSLASGNNYIGQVDGVFVTDRALLMGEINKLYTKSLIDHLPSPKNAGDHIQSMSIDDLLVTFDTLDIAHKVSLKVMS
jgi:hypothetical protein